MLDWALNTSLVHHYNKTFITKIIDQKNWDELKTFSLIALVKKLSNTEAQLKKSIAYK